MHRFLGLLLFALVFAFSFFGGQGELHAYPAEPAQASILASSGLPPLDVEFADLAAAAGAESEEASGDEEGFSEGVGNDVLARACWGFDFSASSLAPYPPGDLSFVADQYEMGFHRPPDFC